LLVQLKPFRIALPPVDATEKLGCLDEFLYHLPLAGAERRGIEGHFDRTPARKPLVEAGRGGE
jgi:hypothetical protein